MSKRVFLIVLDSFGIGEAPDAADFGDEGSNTLAAIANNQEYIAPNLEKIGLFNIEGVPCMPKETAPSGAFARLEEVSCGKDTTTGHWEMAGVESPKAMPVFPNGFPDELITKFEQKTGRKVICNKPYSGTQVIYDYGVEQARTGALIVYTSADSVFQVAANEAQVPVEELYRYCEIARELLVGDWAVGRVIARPYVGDSPETFKRTANRHDISLKPPKPTLLDGLKAGGLDVIGVGKIHDIFAGQGITEKIASKNNDQGMEITLELAKRPFHGLAFVNLVDFDMIYGHRNDVAGYARAISSFDNALGKLLPLLGPEDMLIMTADHGCDPSTPSTDHSREYVPMLAAGKPIKQGANLGTRRSFGCIANTIAEYLGIPASYAGSSFLNEILR